MGGLCLSSMTFPYFKLIYFILMSSDPYFCSPFYVGCESSGIKLKTLQELWMLSSVITMSAMNSQKSEMSTILRKFANHCNNRMSGKALCECDLFSILLVHKVKFTLYCGGNGPSHLLSFPQTLSGAKKTTRLSKIPLIPHLAIPKRQHRLIICEML